MIRHFQFSLFSLKRYAMFYFSAFDTPPFRHAISPCQTLRFCHFAMLCHADVIFAIILSDARCCHFLAIISPDCHFAISRCLPLMAPY
jgi:hypothetical protein